MLQIYFSIFIWSRYGENGSNRIWCSISPWFYKQRWFDNSHDLSWVGNMDKLGVSYQKLLGNYKALKYSEIVIEILKNFKNCYLIWTSNYIYKVNERKIVCYNMYAVSIWNYKIKDIFNIFIIIVILFNISGLPLSPEVKSIR